MRAPLVRAVLVSIVFAAACGSDDSPAPADGGAPPEQDGGAAAPDLGGTPAPRDAAATPAPDGGAERPPASACVTEGERRFTPQAGTHVNSTANVMYNSNPPSSGPHCPQPGAYGQYTPAQPLDRCYWIHNLEHGAIVLLYNCPMGCPDILEGLTRVLADAPRDPDCANRRILITPYPMLDTRVAAAAWGFTWKANCLDDAARAQLVKFIGDHIGSKGMAPEARVCN